MTDDSFMAPVIDESNWKKKLTECYTDLQNKIPPSFDFLVSGSLGVRSTPKINIPKAEFKEKESFNLEECEKLMKIGKEAGFGKGRDFVKDKETRNGIELDKSEFSCEQKGYAECSWKRCAHRYSLVGNVGNNRLTFALEKRF